MDDVWFRCIRYSRCRSSLCLKLFSFKRPFRFKGIGGCDSWSLAGGLAGSLEVSRKSGKVDFGSLPKIRKRGFPILAKRKNRKSAFPEVSQISDGFPEVSRKLENAGRPAGRLAGSRA